MSASKQATSPGQWLVITFVGIIDLFLLYGVTLMYARGELAFALLVLILATAGSWIFISSKGYNYRYVYPCLLGVTTFIVFPLLYTVNVAFTNFSSRNLLPLERVKTIHLAKTYRTGGDSFTFKMFQEGTGFQLALFPSASPSTLPSKSSEQFYVTESFPVLTQPVDIKASITTSLPNGAELAMRDVIKKRSTLKQLDIQLPDGSSLALTSLRKFGYIEKIYQPAGNNELLDTRTNSVIKPDMSTGFYVNDKGEQAGPGFTVYTGWDNFNRVATDPGIQGPFLKIFIWTLTFSLLSVVFTLIIGLLMACLVQWEPLKGNALYRMLLILPYASTRLYFYINLQGAV